MGKADAIMAEQLEREVVVYPDDRAEILFEAAAA
jgi:hypothetical protein